jgi:HSP20 family protein
VISGLPKELENNYKEHRSMNTNCNCSTATNVADEAKPARQHDTVLFTPRVDILENDKEVVLFADLPGVRSEDVELRYEKGELVLTGKVQPRFSEKTFALQEYDEGNFCRAFTLHESIDSARIEAVCKNGVLTVHLPKVEAVQPRQITVKAQ